MPWSHSLLCTNYSPQFRSPQKIHHALCHALHHLFWSAGKGDCHCHSEPWLHLQFCVLQLPWCWPGLSACTAHMIPFSSWDTANCCYHCISFVSYSETAYSVQVGRPLNHSTDRVMCNQKKIHSFVTYNVESPSKLPQSTIFFTAASKTRLL